MKKLILIFILPLLLFTAEGYAQVRTITGKVTSTDGIGLPGANVMVKGTTVGTTTDVDGNYSLDIMSGAEELVFSYVGHVPTEVLIGEKTIINVTLEEDVTELDEIIVIGYGVQKKSLVTGAISKVSAEDLENNQARLEQALQGKTAGVQITQESGSPGGGLSIRIRGVSTNGNSEPLVVVDGVRTAGYEYLNPNDIESVEILKDAASAAIYGAEAANGVIIVTTKTGTKNQESVISYNSNFGIQEATNYMEVLNANQYTTYYTEAERYERENRGLPAKAPRFNPDTIGAGTDWLGEIFTPASMQEHNISITGGNEKTSVFASGSYLTQDGIVGGSKSTFDRYTARLNVSHEAKDWLIVGGNVSYTHFERKSINENNEFGGVISNAMNIDPLTPVYYGDTSQFPDAYKQQIYANFDDIDNSSLSAGEDGYYGMSKYVQNEIVNPVAQIDNTHNKWFTDKVLGVVDLTLKPIEGLTFKTKYDVDLSYGTNKGWTPEYYYHSVNYNYLSNVYKSVNRWFTWQWENTLNYSGLVGLHGYDVLIGNTVRNETAQGIGGLGEGLQEESWNFAQLSAVLSDSTKSAASGYTAPDIRLSSYFGRVQYNYDSRYMLNFTLRADASSKLHESNRMQYFPSVSLGWVVTREDFFNFRPISFLKLRFSWGQNGTLQSLEPFRYVSLIKSDAESSYYISGGTRLAGAEPGRLSNPDLVWETSQQTDVGVDIRFLNNSLALSADYYQKKTIDLITIGSVPAYVGNNPPFVNAGEVTNTGVELELSYNSQIAGLNYQISANAAYNKNEVTSMESIERANNVGTSGTLSRAELGYPIWYFYGFQDDGIFNSFDEINAYINEDGDPIQPNAIPGDIRFVDVNGDGRITEDDKTMIGSPHPDWIFGLSANLEYKGFDLSVFVNGTLGNEVYFGGYRTDLNDNNKLLFMYEDAWTPENHSQEFPRYTVSDINNNFSHNSMFVFDGSYVRLSNIELGYTFNMPVLNQLQIQKLRIYFSAKNLFVLSNYPSGDPEVGISGIDKGLYPRPRIISFGVNLSL